MKSMTGFGRANYENDGRTYIIDIKTVNNKYSDINIKMPRIFSIMEDKIRKAISNSVSRGKIDVSISFNDYTNKTKKVIINKEIANEYIKKLIEIADENKIDHDLNLVDIVKLPEVLNVEDIDNQEQISIELLNCLNMAVENLISMRLKEGNNIKLDLIQRINRVENLVKKFDKDSEGLVKEYIIKLQKRVNELLEDKIADENRVAQEAVIYADKISIQEELTRLQSHIQQFKELINVEDKPIGKKLDFVIQEMNRETNTIGSKAGNCEITNTVIDLKMELEDIREQIQNIE